MDTNKHESPHVVARCPKCMNELARDGACPKCEGRGAKDEPVDKEAAALIERLRKANANFKPVVAARERAVVWQRKRLQRASWWMGRMQNEKGKIQNGEMPLAGQDAALPVGDR